MHGPTKACQKRFFQGMRVPVVGVSRFAALCLKELLSWRSVVRGLHEERTQYESQILHLVRQLLAGRSTGCERSHDIGADHKQRNVVGHRSPYRRRDRHADR